MPRKKAQKTLRVTGWVEVSFLRNERSERRRISYFVILHSFQHLVFYLRPTWRNACQGKERAKDAQGDKKENRSFEGNVFPRRSDPELIHFRVTERFHYFIGTVSCPVYHSYNYNHFKKKVKSRVKRLILELLDYIDIKDGSFRFKTVSCLFF